jgi:hypothetical protein
MSNFNLFTQHLEDLKCVCPNAGDVFVCPICFKVIDRNNAGSETSLGHIWPSFIRASSEKDTAKHQQVLLCTKCNNTAGRRGDNEMQKREQERQGQLPHRMSINPKDGTAPFDIFVFIDKIETHEDEDSEITFRFQMPKGEFLNSEKMRRFRMYQENQEKLDVIVAGFNTNWYLAQAGWLTSAYLFAFYVFGYKYIFHTALDPVRNYILQSFENKVDSRLTMHTCSKMSVQTCTLHKNSEPVIVYQIQTEGKPKPHHLEVSFLDYHVRLPLGMRKSQIWTETDISEILGSQTTMLEQIPDNAMLAMDVSDHRPHGGNCIWDKIMAVNNYDIVENQIEISQG